LGTVAELTKKLNGQDPIEWAKKYIDELNKKEQEEKRKIMVQYSPTKIIDKDQQRSFNCGYLFLQKTYYELGLHKICKEISDKYKFDFDLNSILSRLVYSRIIYPSSKLATYQLASRFIEQPNFELHQIYRALEVIAKENDFIQSSFNIMEISNQETYENTAERAVYGIAYARPSKRLASLLCVDRELLIVFTTFRDQQARTVKTVSQFIDQSNGRLETTLAIVVHPDPQGNNKLKNFERALLEAVSTYGPEHIDIINEDDSKVYLAYHSENDSFMVGNEVVDYSNEHNLSKIESLFGFFTSMLNLLQPVRISANIKVISILINLFISYLL